MYWYCNLKHLCFIDIPKKDLGPGHLIAVYADTSFVGDPFWLFRVTSISPRKVVGFYLEKDPENQFLYKNGQGTAVKWGSIVRSQKNLKRLYILDLFYNKGYLISDEIKEFLLNLCT